MTFFCRVVLFLLYKLQIRHTSEAPFVQERAPTKGGYSPLPSGEHLLHYFHFQWLVLEKEGRQDFREARVLIGWADGNALKVRSAGGIDHRLGPVPRWELCWRSFVSLRAICCGWREEYKERESMDKGWLIMFSVIYLLFPSPLSNKFFLFCLAL